MSKWPRSMLTHKQEVGGAIETVSPERIEKLGKDIQTKIDTLKTAEAHNAQLTGHYELNPDIKRSLVRPSGTKDSLGLMFSRLRNYALTKPVRDKAFTKWVRSKPCVGCGNPAEGVHHISGSAGSLKSTDYFTVPMCNPCNGRAETDREFRESMVEAYVKMILDGLTKGELRV